MPEWVIVGEEPGGEPMVLTDWVMELSWIPIAELKQSGAAPLVFRDRWRAKRQSRRLPRSLAPRALRRDRL